MGKGVLLRRSRYLIKPKVARVCEGYLGYRDNDFHNLEEVASIVRFPNRGNLFKVVEIIIPIPKVALADSGNLGLYDVTASP